MITLSRRQTVEQRVKREQELERLALAAVRSFGVGYRDEWPRDRKQRVADLLVFLGVLLDTPQAKCAWIEED
jgi:hypothetical protein